MANAEDCSKPQTQEEDRRKRLLFIVLAIAILFGLQVILVGKALQPTAAARRSVR